MLFRSGDLNEAPENIYTVFYPTVARRVVEKVVRLAVPRDDAGRRVRLNLKPMEPGIVFEKIIVDFGGYRPSYLFGEESDCVKKF